MSSRISSEQIARTTHFIENAEMSLMDVTESNTKVVRVRKADPDDASYLPKRSRNATFVADSIARAIIPIRTSLKINETPSSVMHQTLLTDKLLKRQRDIDVKLKGPEPLERGLLERNLLSRIAIADYEEAMKINEGLDQIQVKLEEMAPAFKQIYMNQQQCQLELFMALQGQTLQESPQEYQARQKRYAVNCEQKWAEFVQVTIEANRPRNLSEGVKVALISMNK